MFYRRTVTIHIANRRRQVSTDCARRTRHTRTDRDQYGRSPVNGTPSSIQFDESGSPRRGEWQQHGRHGQTPRGSRRVGPTGAAPVARDTKDRRRGWRACSDGRSPANSGPAARGSGVATAASAILDRLRTAAEVGERSDGYRCHPADRASAAAGRGASSPGLGLPDQSFLHDEGLLETDDEMGRKTLRLTAQGATYVTEHADAWPPCGGRTDPTDNRRPGEYADLKPEIGQAMGACWQIVTQGSEASGRAAVDCPRSTPGARATTGILADGHDARPGTPSRDLEDRVWATPSGSVTPA